MTALAWQPTARDRARSQTARFMGRHGVATYDELVARSTAEPDWFWDAVVRFLGIPFMVPYSRVRDRARGVPWTTWFDDGSINLSAACLDRWADDPGHADRSALVAEAEDGSVAWLWPAPCPTTSPRSRARWRPEECARATPWHSCWVSPTRP